MTAPPGSAHRAAAVLAITSNKGGVGKTTLATNLAVYFRALFEELPVLLIGLDDQRVIDRMFALRALEPGQGHLKHGWAERCLDRVMQLGQYGVYYVPSPPDTALLKVRASDPTVLRHILERTHWNGLVLLDTKSDLEALTLNALTAADRILIPISDRSALDEADKTFTLLERERIPRQSARVVLTLVDVRSRMANEEQRTVEFIEAEVRRRGWLRYRTAISRSPRVEALNSGSERPLSILHHAAGTSVHRQLRDLALEIAQDLHLGGAARRTPGVRESEPLPGTPARSSVGELGRAVLRSLWRG